MFRKEEIPCLYLKTFSSKINNDFQSVIFKGNNATPEWDTGVTYPTIPVFYGNQNHFHPPSPPPKKKNQGGNSWQGEKF